jgi:hypothetical protein
LVTKFFQIADDCGESHRDVSVDILKETLAWSHDTDSIFDPRPEVSGVVFPFAVTGCGKWLARIPAAEDTHSVTKEFPREGFKVRVDRARIQLSFFNAAEKDRDREGFPFTVSDCS